MEKKKIRLTINKKALSSLQGSQLAEVTGGRRRRPPESHSCATCVSGCKTMIICNC
jgi:hypothetical protein